MKKEIQNAVSNIFWKTIFMIFTFAFLNLLILLLFKDYPIVKDVLSNTVSFSSAAATLAAALIAAYLFNDWREQSKFEVKRDYALDALRQTALIHKELLVSLNVISIIENVNTPNMNRTTFDRLESITILKDREKISSLYSPLRILDSLEKNDLVLTKKYSALKVYVLEISSRYLVIKKAYDDYLKTKEITFTDSPFFPGSVGVSIDQVNKKKALRFLKSCIKDKIVFDPELKKSDSLMLGIDDIYHDAKCSDVIIKTKNILDSLEKDLIEKIKPS